MNHESAKARDGLPMQCDVLIAGSGAAGLATALVAKHHGLDVVVVDKEPVFGGTTAFSGGVMWVPCNPVSQRAGQPPDTVDAARRYLQAELGEGFDAEPVEAFLANGPAAISFFERHTSSVRFVPTLYPDYHPNQPGGVDVGRAILAEPFDIRLLGADMARLRPPLQSITFMGMMFNRANADLKHFFQATQSVESARYVGKRLLRHAWERARYGRAAWVTSGNALAARLAKSALDAGIPIHTTCPVVALLQEAPDASAAAGRVTGAVVQHNGRQVNVQARHAVVLACGGFAQDAQRVAQAYPHVARGGTHFTPVPSGNTGDGGRLAERAGGHLPLRYPHAAAWMPVSRVPMEDGREVAFPHLLDRYKPGVIAVLRNGQRFCNESESYHDVGAAMVRACATVGDGRETAAWLICDATTLGKYGLGFVKPAPLPHGQLIRKGYLIRGESLAALARGAGIDADGLQRTVDAYNPPARTGQDPQFHRGSTAFNRYLADPAVRPNPCVAPIERGPFYAVKLEMGDLGSFDGLRTTVAGQVLHGEGDAVIPGLYAVGNDRASVMAGHYPGAGITLGPHLTFGYLTGQHLGLAAGRKPM